MRIAASLNTWSMLYNVIAICTVLTSLCLLSKKRTLEQIAPTVESTSTQLAIRPADFLCWLFFPFVSSVTLVAYSAHLTEDIAPIPFFWALPLGAYLLSYIICFANPLCYKRTIFVLLCPTLWILELFLRFNIWCNIAGIVGLVFCISMVCHGELIMRKPPVSKLPWFYLAIALGGVLGSACVNFVMPYIFSFYLERTLVFVFTVFMSYRVAQSVVAKTVWLRNAFLVTILVVPIAIAYNRHTNSSAVICQKRNFYGVLSVSHSKDNGIELIHGRISHGVQYSDRPRTPTLYYERKGPVGMLDELLRREHQKVRYGIVGLGTGCLAAYGKRGDRMTFYEIDPKVIDIAEEYFTWIKDSPFEVDTILGDARISLAHQAPQNYDFLLIDAFNSDAVPMHLLTEEALATYLKHLAPDGILAFHISNRYLNLQPVVANLAYQANLHAYTFRAPCGEYVAISRVPWIDHDLDMLKSHGYPDLQWHPSDTSTRVGIWTDDFSNLLSVCRMAQAQQ